MKTSPNLRAVLGTALAVLTACGSSTNPGGPIVPAQARSSLGRDTSPSVPPADASALVAGNTAFAADLLKVVAKHENAMISPYSVSLALAMCWAGAKGDTATQMADALHFTLAPAKLHPAFDQLDLALASRGQNAQGKDGKPFRLKVTNAAWAEKTFEFVPSYLDTLAVDYGAGVNLLDFVNDAEGGRVTINDWVAQETEDRIKDLLAPGTVDASTRLVLTNAVYFNAAWLDKFEKSSTRDAQFNLADGSPVTTSTMVGQVHGRWAESADWLATELPYDGGEVALTLVMPKAGGLEAFTASLDGAKLQAITGALADETLLIDLPKFKFEWKASLAEALAGLGMEAAFTSKADFSGIHAEGGLTISDVVHQTFVAVDEDGTEAAAATAVVMTGAAMPVGRQVSIDHPFLFMIRDVQTGSVIFLGQVFDPRQ